MFEARGSFAFELTTFLAARIFINCVEEHVDNVLQFGPIVIKQSSIRQNVMNEKKLFDE